LLVRTQADLSAMWESVRKAPVVAWDTETTSLNWLDAQLVGYSLATSEGSWYVPTHDYWNPLPNCLTPLRNLFELDTLIVAHNFKYDAHIVRQNLGVQFPEWMRWADTMVAAHMCQENRQIGLKPLATEYCGFEMLEFDEMLKLAAELKGLKRNEKATIFDVPLDILGEYGARDAEATYELWTYLEPELEANEQTEAFWNVEMPFLRVLLEAEERGVLLDVEACKRLKAEAEVKLTDLEQQIQTFASSLGWYKTKGKKKVTVIPFNPGSTDQVSELLFDMLKLRPTGRTTPGGSPSVDDGALKILRDNYPDVDVVNLLLEYRNLSKRIGGFYGNLLTYQRDGVIHPDFNQCGARTGRISCSSPNLMNQPRSKDVRNMFIARPGHLLLDADYSQAELRYIAHLSGDETMMTVYNDPKGDIHQTTADRIGIDRQTAKPVNFGTAYGIAPKAFQSVLRFDYGIKVSLEEAKRYIDGWFDTYSAVKPYQARVIQELDDNGYVVNMYGRRRHLPDIWNNECVVTQRGNTNHRYYPKREYAKRQAINFVIQGSVGFLVKKAMVALREAIKPLGGIQLLSVHDEILVEVPEEHADECAKVMHDVMVGAGKLNVPIVADVSKGKTWGEAH
jgi:DNA polymerase-1